MEEIILKEQRLREEIVKLINESQLPAFIISPILKDMLEATLQIKEQQLNEAQKYEETKKEKKKKEDK